MLPGMLGSPTARRRIGLACAVVLAATTCATPRDWVPLTLEPEPVYEEFYPYYVELCAVSQIRKLGAKPGGGPGHAVMYLKGACRDPLAPYPTLQMCPDQEVDPADPEHGVGISVNKWFRNVNWVAVPTKKLFFDGNLAAGQRLTQEHYDATVRSALELGVFRGVQVHAQHPAGQEPSRMAAFVAEDSIATDFALRFARSIHCARVPVTRVMLERIVEYLNELNRAYATGEADYQWSGYSDNCVHTLHNALAYASVWPPKSVQSIKLRQLFNLAVPANTFIDLAVRTAEYPIEDLRKVERDVHARTSLLEYGWLPGSHGVALRRLKVHQDNDLFDTRFHIFILEGLLLPYGNKQAVVEMSRDARYVEVRANLRRYDAVYQAILAEQPEETASDFQAAYYDYIAAQLARVQEHLGRLGVDRP